MMVVEFHALFSLFLPYHAKIVGYIMFTQHQGSSTIVDSIKTDNNRHARNRYESQHSYSSIPFLVLNGFVCVGVYLYKN